jgi:hypothetical protein
MAGLAAMRVQLALTRPHGAQLSWGAAKAANLRKHARVEVCVTENTGSTCVSIVLQITSRAPAATASSARQTLPGLPLQVASSHLDFRSSFS